MHRIPSASYPVRRNGFNAPAQNQTNTAACHVSCIRMPAAYGNSLMPPWKKRMLLVCFIVLIVTSLLVLAGMTWGVFAIWQDRAGMRRVPATIVSVDSSKRSSFGRSVKFGTYNLTVRYRNSDGREVTDGIEDRTFGFPSPGDSITLLIGPSGRAERNPLPEVVPVVASVYAGFGWLVWLIIKYVRPVFR
jgi:hypothetical protein